MRGTVATDPLTSAKAAGLRYTTDAKPGIRRKRNGSGFVYIGVGGRPVRDRAELARIRSLVIPPAWRDVWICPDPRGHLQATGRDVIDLLRILAGQKAGGTPVVDRYIPLQFSLLNEDTYPHQGRLDFASISASPTSGTLTLRGIFPNPKGNILPGLFTRVRAPLGKPADALVVPGDAISFDQQGRYAELFELQAAGDR